MEREEIKMGIWIFLGKAKKNTKKDFILIDLVLKKDLNQTITKWKS